MKKPTLTDDLPEEMPDLSDDSLKVSFSESAQEHGGRLKPFAIAKTVDNKRRGFIDATRANVIKGVLPRLPGKSKSIHVLVSQAFAGFDLVPHFLRLSGEKSFDSLYLTTLGFSRENLAALGEMVGASIPPACLKILCGDFFRRSDSGLWDIGALLAKERGFVFRSARNHTKLILAKIGGHHLVVESSANLRSCRSIETFTVSDSRDLFGFHKSWIDEVLKDADK